MAATTITSSTSSYIPPISVPGIGTSIGVNSLVSSLMKVEGLPLTQLQTQQSSHQTQLSAVESLKSTPSTFQTTLLSLTNVSNYSAMKASDYDTSMLSASVAGSAPTGSYTVNVTQLVQSQVLAVQGQASATTTIGSGVSATISFSLDTVSSGSLSGGKYTGSTFAQNGNLAGDSITINPSSSTLAGICDAINSASLGVPVGIVDDDSGSPCHLVLTPTAGGSSSEIEISVSGDSTLQSLLPQDPAGAQNVTKVTTDRNALIAINGIAVQSPTNALSNVVGGTSFTLSETDSTNMIVANDPTATTTAVTSFVSGYSALRTQLNGLTNIDTANKANNGPLTGDVSTKTLINQITDMLNRAVDSGNYQSLGNVDVTMDSDGTLSVDNTKLSAVIAKSPSQVTGLFAGTGTATDSLVSVPTFLGSTQAGSYAVSVTQLTTRGTLTGSATANTTIMVGANDTLAFGISGMSVNVTLTAGNYTATTLTAQIQSQVNASTTLQNAKVNASVSANTSGMLSITDSQFSSVSAVSVSGTRTSSLFGSSPISTNGMDVQGTINGVTATGSDRNLYGIAGSTVDGLTVQITGDPLGARGTVTVQHGYAAQLNTMMNSPLASSGMLQNETDSINSSLTSLASQITAMQTRLDNKQALYYTQFSALSSAVASMTNTGNYLTAQFAAITKQISSSN